MSFEITNGWILVTVVGGLIAVGIWVGKMEAFRNTTQTLLREIRDDIKAILLRTNSPAVERGSSLRLTELGKKISCHLKAAEWSRERLSQISQTIKPTSSSYEVQEKCFSFVRSAIDKDASYRRQVEECAFEHGISVADVIQVVGIELRDELLRARGATTPSES